MKIVTIMPLIALGILAVLLAPAGAEETAAPPAPSVYECLRIDTSITIDGRLDEPVWQDAASSGPFGRLGAAPGTPAGENTDVKLLWDRSGLYIGAVCHDRDIIAPYTERDASLWEHDVFELFLDANGSGYYYEFEVNPNNAVLDLIMLRSGTRRPDPIVTWNCDDIRTGVSVDGTIGASGDTDTGWSLEMLIPWGSLFVCRPLPPRHGDEWRANLYRGNHTRRQRPEYSFWSYVADFHDPEHFGIIRFLDPQQQAAVAASRALAAVNFGAHTIQAWSLASRLDRAVIASYGGKAYDFDSHRHTYRSSWRRVGPDPDGNPQTVVIKPGRSSEATGITWQITGLTQLFAWYRLAPESAADVLTGLGNGIRLQAVLERDGLAAAAFEAHVDDGTWRCTAVNLDGPADTEIRLTLSQGPSQSFHTDVIELIIGGDGAFPAD